jgi:riboflavin transporter FmnP
MLHYRSIANLQMHQHCDILQHAIHICIETLSKAQNDSRTNTVTSTFVIVIPFCVLKGVLGALNFILDISDKSNTLHPLK